MASTGINDAMKIPASLVSLALLSLSGLSRQAVATEAIVCRDTDTGAEVTVAISLTQEAAGNGVYGLRIDHPALRSTETWRVERARVDPRAQVLSLRARNGDTPRNEVLELRADAARGTLTSPTRRLALSCDWSAFDQRGGAPATPR